MFAFQETIQNARVLNDVVEITVENDVISNLPEPVRISFRHDVVAVSLQAGVVAVMHIFRLIFCFSFCDDSL